MSMKEEEILLTAEEIAKNEIIKASDAEQVICKKLSEFGEPIIYIVYRSKLQNRQVVEIPEYSEVRRGGQLVGYGRQGEKLQIQNYGTENESTLSKRA